MSNNSTEKERTPLRVEVAEPLEFDAIASAKYISSIEFCKIVSELFKGVFADFEGCFFDPAQIQTGELSLSLIFNHGKYGDDEITACERPGTKSTGGSTVIDNRRRQDLNNRIGDRFLLTEDGKDALAPLLVARLYNNGNPKWSNCVADFTDNTPMTMYHVGMAPQYTKVSGIDLRRLCSLIYGEKNGDDVVDYMVSVAMNMTLNASFGMNVNPNFLLRIDRASANEVAKLYEKLGYGTAGTPIIR